MSRQIYNVHRREIDAPVTAIGALLDSLASTDDRLWPVDSWPAMSFDRPGLTAGGQGGHGPIGYRVDSTEPGRSATFTFTGRPRGLLGGHQYVVQRIDADRAALWHLSQIRPMGLMRMTWPLFWAPLHDALIEDSLDRAQRNAVPARAVVARRWTIYVRVLRAILGLAARRLGRSEFVLRATPVDDLGSATNAPDRR